MGADGLLGHGEAPAVTRLRCSTRPAWLGRTSRSGSHGSTRPTWRPRTGLPRGFRDRPRPGRRRATSAPGHNPAYVRGDAVVAAGKFGNGIALDGVDDRVEVPFDRSIDVGADDFTMMAWIKYGASTAAQSILWAYRQGSGTTSQVWLRAEPANKRIVALLAVASDSTSPFSRPRRTTTTSGIRSSLQRAGGKFKLLVDGVEVGSADAPPGSVSTGQEFGIQGIHVGQRVDGANRFQAARSTRSASTAAPCPPPNWPCSRGGTSRSAAGSVSGSRSTPCNRPAELARRWRPPGRGQRHRRPWFTMLKHPAATGTPSGQTEWGWPCSPTLPNSRMQLLLTRTATVGSHPERVRGAGFGRVDVAARRRIR